MEELNKKLAEWAGFKREIRHFDKGLLGEHRISAPRLEPQEYSDRYWTNLEDYPDFTQSLDTCFKWLVPKLENYHLTISRGPLGGTAVILYRRPKENFIGNDETPALALCKAIEKLIDGEKDAVLA